MIEGFPNPTEGEDRASEIRRRAEEIVTSARELSESGEVFPFPGLDPEEYSKMKATDEEYPGYTTPTDEIVERLKSEGMKVVLNTSARPGNCEVFVLPTGSDDIGMDGISARKLQIQADIDERLKQLILQGLSLLEFTKAG